MLDAAVADRTLVLRESLDATARRANAWALLLDRRAPDEDNACSDPMR